MIGDESSADGIRQDQTRTDGEKLGHPEDTTTRQIAEPARDELDVICPDCGSSVEQTKGSGKPLPMEDVVTFGWECSDCDLTFPSHCRGPNAPHFTDAMVGIEIEFRDGHSRFVPVPARCANADTDDRRGK